ncbi:hypothetical protein HDF25_003248 [Pedobacter cryoconitis]|uniref:Uncharacterized protein n=1 Tax=Pedobacter cryoconitis TaxID=188932 RepID=A0A7X0J4U1_9SPHI|nr:hypothetical protein [Pedobacter cryoconitis]
MRAGINHRFNEGQIKGFLILNFIFVNYQGFAQHKISLLGPENPPPPITIYVIYGAS